MDPSNTDTDNDTLEDGIEVFESKTNPNNPDTDGDTLLDGWEFNIGMDPLSIEDVTLDNDGDGWLNIQEFQLRHPSLIGNKRAGRLA